MKIIGKMESYYNIMSLVLQIWPKCSIITWVLDYITLQVVFKSLYSGFSTAEMWDWKYLVDMYASFDWFYYIYNSLKVATHLILQSLQINN